VRGGVSAGDARRITRQIGEQFDLIRAGDPDPVAEAMQQLRPEDLLLLFGSMTVVAAHALDAVSQLGGSKDQVLRQGVDLAYDGMMGDQGG
jgi:hypothetical protein